MARIEVYVEEGADILFLDSSADEAEIARAIDAAALGFKIGTFHPILFTVAATTTGSRSKISGLADRRDGTTG